MSENTSNHDEKDEKVGDKAKGMEVKKLSEICLEWIGSFIVFHSQLENKSVQLVNQSNSKDQRKKNNRKSLTHISSSCPYFSTEFRNFKERLRYLPSKIQVEIVGIIGNRWNRLSCDVLRLFTFFDSHLEALELEKSHCVGEEKFPQTISQLGDQLNSLSVRNCIGLSEYSIIQISKKIKKLKFLDLSGNELEDKPISILTANCIELKELILNSCPNINSSFLSGKEFPHIERISLDNSTNITNETVDRIASLCKQLKVLSLKGCKNVSSIKKIGENCKRLVSLNVEETLVDNITDLVEGDLLNLVELRFKGCGKLEINSLLCLFPHHIISNRRDVPCLGKQLIVLTLPDMEFKRNEMENLNALVDNILIHSQNLRELHVAPKFKDMAEYFPFVKKLMPLIQRQICKFSINESSNGYLDHYEVDPQQSIDVWNFECESITQLTLRALSFESLKVLSEKMPNLTLLHVDRMNLPVEGDLVVIPNFSYLEDLSISFALKHGDFHRIFSFILISTSLIQLDLPNYSFPVLFLDLPQLESIRFNGGSTFWDNLQVDLNLPKVKKVFCHWKAPLIRELINKTSNTLEVLDIKTQENMDIGDVLSKAIHLRKFKMSGKNLVDGIFNFKEHFKNLRDIEIRTSSKGEELASLMEAESIQIDEKTMNTNSGMEMRSNWISPLNRIVLSGFKQLTKIEINNLMITIQTIQIITFPNLQYFYIYGKEGKRGLASQLLSITLWYCGALLEVKISNSSIVELNLESNVSLNLLQLKTPKLKKLVLHHSVNVDDSQIISIIDSCPLEYLGVKSRHIQSDNPLFFEAKKKKGLVLDRGKVSETHQRFPKRSTR
eukprot:TRINITY_DN3938_c0_g2_i3.p1 TRINITY_DN3938_c0_g2~~TRINITY_DN3938_c0_g2_i3.p1  ORF type:complete len:839 (-),score=254.14 TRINITY_DN3938_c0_g2_i3:6193-8709(-)